MTRKIPWFLFSTFLILIPAPAFGKVVDRIVAIVNNEAITQREVDNLLGPVYEQYRAVYYGDELISKLEEARKGVVERLIDDRLILSEAKKLNIEASDVEIEARLRETEKRFSSRAMFEQAMTEQGVSIKELKRRYKEQIMVRKLIDQKIGSKVNISPSEMSDYYEKHINEFIQPEEISLKNILIRPKQGRDLKESERLAKDISARLKDGCDFAGLAREYSEGPNAQDGGSMGYVKKGDLLPDIEAVVFNLKAGEVSNVIQTNLGYHIFKVEDKRERRTREFAEVRHDVEEAIFRDKAQYKIKDWVAGLRKNAYIEFK